MERCGEWAHFDAAFCGVSVDPRGRIAPLCWARWLGLGNLGDPRHFGNLRDLRRLGDFGHLGRSGDLWYSGDRGNRRDLGNLGDLWHLRNLRNLWDLSLGGRDEEQSEEGERLHERDCGRKADSRNEQVTREREKEVGMMSE